MFGGGRGRGAASRCGDQSFSDAPCPMKDTDWTIAVARVRVRRTLLCCLSQVRWVEPACIAHAQCRTATRRSRKTRRYSNRYRRGRRGHKDRIETTPVLRAGGRGGRGGRAAQTGLKQPQSCGLIARVQRQVASIGYPAAFVVMWGIPPSCQEFQTATFFDFIYLAGYPRSERAHAFEGGFDFPT
jgi:hypothetical protein